jgi:hypothetical protein
MTIKSMCVSLALVFGLCSTMVAEVIVRSYGRVKSSDLRYVQYRKGTTTVYQYYKKGSNDKGEKIMLDSEYVAVATTTKHKAPRISSERAERMFYKFEKEYNAQQALKKHPMHVKQKAMSKENYMPSAPSRMSMEEGAEKEPAQNTFIKIVHDVCVDCGCSPSKEE